MTDTTSQFDDASADITAEPVGWNPATWFAVISMAATSFALV
jgi:DHA1 family purine ribonucleoside efflux pump-like MFS transporter